MGIYSPDLRRSLVDAGTAVEAALTVVLGLPIVHDKTLGALVNMALKQSHAIPADTRTALVEPRNNAIHRGDVTPGTNVNRALEVAEAIIAKAEPSLIPVSNLTYISRPQRQDIYLIAGPKESVENR
jgi:hypothetical protein